MISEFWMILENFIQMDIQDFLDGKICMKSRMKICMSKKLTIFIVCENAYVRLYYGKVRFLGVCMFVCIYRYTQHTTHKLTKNTKAGLKGESRWKNVGSE